MGYEYLGEREVKNIAAPVRVYMVQLDSGASAIPTATREHLAPSLDQEQSASRRRSLVGLVVGAGLMVAVWVLVYRPFGPPPSAPPAGVTTEELPALPFPDKPSIAVLPFTNMSGDPEQEYFSDGITDDIITDLSKVTDLFVISRNSVFTYKGQAVKVEDVGREIDVKWLAWRVE